MVLAKYFLSVILAALAVKAAPTVESEVESRAAALTTLTSAQVAAFKPYSFLAAAAYCNPANTLAWNCGTNCNNSPNFKPVASGGNGDSVQYWFVGYDSGLKTVIVSHQGTDTSHILPIITDANFFLTSLDSSLFPGVSSSVEVHNGFAESQADSATAILAAVQTAMSRYSATKVTIVGHSLGGAIALISSMYLPLHLPAGTTFKTITYGAPRVGNQAFVDYVNARRDVSRVWNQDDIVPILPGRFLGFAHVNGEKHILNSLAWVDCPGEDNTDSNCGIGYVPNILAGETGDHAGPYDGVHMGC